MDTHGPDLSDLLRDIRAQYDLAAKKNREESDEWYSAKVSISETALHGDIKQCR